MTTPITITNQAALEQGQRVAREAKELPTERGVWRQGLTLVMVCQRGGDPKLRAVFPSGYECYVTGLTRGGWLEVDPSPLPREVSPAEQETPADEPRIGSAADYDFEREAKAWKGDAPAYSSTFPPEIPPHIQFLRQLPAAKAGQAIEEAAADRIRELEAENARLSEQAKERLGFLDEISEHVKQILSHHPPLEMLPVVVRKMAESHKRRTADLAALAERERVAKDALEAAHKWMGYAFRYCDSTIRDMYDEVLPKVSSAISTLSPAPSPPQAGEGATGDHISDAGKKVDASTAADHTLMPPSTHSYGKRGNCWCVSCIETKMRMQDAELAEALGQRDAARDNVIEAETKLAAKDAELAKLRERLAEVERERDESRAYRAWRESPTYPQWGDTKFKNRNSETPDERRAAAKRLIQQGECLGGCGSPYGKHTGNAIQFDEIAVGEGYLELEQQLATVRAEAEAAKGKIAKLADLWIAANEATRLIGKAGFEAERCATAVRAFFDEFSIEINERSATPSTERTTP